MMDEEQFNALVEEIKSQGHSEDEAADFAAQIGDRPVRDEHGRILVVKDNGVVIKLQPLKFFGESK